MKKEKTIIIRVQPYQKKWLAQRSKANKSTISYEVREIIDNAIQANSN